MTLDCKDRGIPMSYACEALPATLVVSFLWEPNLEPTTMPTIIGTANPGARSMVWHLEAGGWSEREAGNLVALLHGLKPSRNGWTVREIEHLRFLQSMVKTGRIAR